MSLCSVKNVQLVTCISGFNSSRDTYRVYDFFPIIVFILLLKNFTTFKYVKCDNLRGPQRRLYSLIYISATFFYVAKFG